MLKFAILIKNKQTNKPKQSNSQDLYCKWSDPIFCLWMNVVPLAHGSGAFAFLWGCLRGSPFLSRDGGHSPPPASRDLPQQLLLLCILQGLFFLLGNGSKSPNCRLKAKYYFKKNHIRGSISIKPAEYTVCIYCVSIKPSPPQIWQVPWIFFTDPLQSVSFFHSLCKALFLCHFWWASSFLKKYSLILVVWGFLVLQLGMMLVSVQLRNWMWTIFY